MILFDHSHGVTERLFLINNRRKSECVFLMFHDGWEMWFCFFCDVICLGASICFNVHPKSGWNFDPTWVAIVFVWKTCFQISSKHQLLGIYKTEVTTDEKTRCWEKNPMGFQHQIWKAQDDGQQIYLFLVLVLEHVWGETLLQNHLYLGSTPHPVTVNTSFICHGG